MQDWRGRDARTEIIGGSLDETPVGDVQERDANARRRIGELGRGSEPREARRRAPGRDQRSRKQPPNPARVKSRKADATESAEISNEKLGDEIPRQHEEHIDADEPAA